MLLAEQVRGYFPDLSDARMQSATVYGSPSFSTNTFPAATRTPNRCHSCTTARSSPFAARQRMNARQMLIETDKFGRDFKRVLPIIDRRRHRCSTTRSNLWCSAATLLAHAMMMMVPEPWSKHRHMSETKQAFTNITAVSWMWTVRQRLVSTRWRTDRRNLDRNLYVLHANTISKTTAISGGPKSACSTPPESVRLKRAFAAGRVAGRHEPGSHHWRRRTERKRLDKKSSLMAHGFAANLKTLDTIQTKPANSGSGSDADQPFARRRFNKLQHAFGHTLEELRVVLAPMAANGGDWIDGQRHAAGLHIESHETAYNTANRRPRLPTRRSTPFAKN